MAKKSKPEEPKKGCPAWQGTFADLMNLLLCFFVLLFSMSTVDAKKFELVAASFNQQTFSIFNAGATAIGDGVLISNGVSQLNELSEFMNSMGASAEGESEELSDKTAEELREAMTTEGLEESEQMAELIEEAMAEQGMLQDVDIDFTSQYVQLTLKGSMLFDSGSTELKEDCIPVLQQVGVILEKYAGHTIVVEGHTDNVPMSGAKYSNNDELSSGRALSVFNYLVQNTTVNPASIQHAGRGEYVPIADNSTPEGRARNRRVEINIYNSVSDF